MKNHFFKRIIGLLFSIFLLITYQSLSAQQKVWSLNDCISQALRENISLNQNITNSGINQINYDQAKANLLPNLNLNDQHSLNFGKSTNQVTNQYSNQNSSTNNLTLNSNVTLYNGLKNINLIKENKLNYEAGNLDIEKLKNDLMLNVIAAYMQVLFQYEAINIAQAQIEATLEHLNYTDKYVKAGSLPESNSYQMRAQLATDKAAKVDAENQLQLAKVILMQLMELPVSPGFEIERPDMKELSPDISMATGEIYHIAESFLPEIKSAAIKTRSAETGLKVSRSGLLPKLTLSGNLGTYYSSAYSLNSYQTISNIEHIGYLANNPSEIVDGPVSTTITNSSNYPFFRQINDNFSQGISLNLSVPIFNNFLNKNEIKKSEIAIQVANLNEKLVKNQLRKNIEIAYTDQLAASKNYIATKEQLASEELSYRNVTVKFKAGIINTTDFFVEKTIYNKALLAHLQAKYQYLFKTKIVNFYLGNSITD